MAHYAFLNDDNFVVEVIVGRDEDDLVNGVESWEDYYGMKRGMRCLRTSYNTFGGVYYDSETNEPAENQNKAFRFNYAGVGYFFDETKGSDGAFIAPKPGDNFILDETSCLWVKVVEPSA